MPTLNLVAAWMWQDQLAGSANDIHWMTIFVGVIAGFFLIAAIALVVVGVIVAKVAGKVTETVKNLEAKATPILSKATEIIDELKPKIAGITTNVEQMTYTVREKVDELGATMTQLNETVREANGRTKAQVVRVDGMVSQGLTATQEITQSVVEGIKKPVNQIAALVARTKASLETLAEKVPFLKHKMQGQRYDM